jgi:hypothetical protein
MWKTRRTLARIIGAGPGMVNQPTALAKAVSEMLHGGYMISRRGRHENEHHH